MSDTENSPGPDVKPEATAAGGDAAGGDAETISVKVTDGTTDVTFKVKQKTPLSRVMDAFCKRIGKQRSSLRFLFDGERVQEDDTAATLGLEDFDKIEALNQQTGGC